MNAETPLRGAHLVSRGRRAVAGSGWLARLAAGGFHRIVDRIAAGLAHGSMRTRLPDGSERLLGGRAPGPEAEIELKHWNALLRLATGGSVGWYQAWEAGEWDSPDPVQIFALFMRNAGTLGGVARAKGPWRWLLRHLHWLHRNTRDRAQENIAAHYDLGNDFYAAWLGETMIYSSGMFAREEDGPSPWAQFFEPIDRAQSIKCGEIARRLAEGPVGNLLEIGCGWGALAARLAEDFEAPVVAISLSDEQLAFARQAHAAQLGRVEFRKQDYRDVTGQFDAIVSVEMVEAVGRRYWPDFFDCLARCLAPGGRAVLQYISIRDELFDAYAASADFIQAYVFPGGMLVREREFRRLAAERGLEWRDQADFGLDYAETLRLWRENFDAAVEEGGLPAGFDARFVRLWRYYLMYCEGGFRGGGIDVSQVTLVKR
ncbi:MAG TPA: cyclopropane-fatty-acyl-phospholipid synthase family protein [Novosphingobium sp.]|nr:cyclopropane-fatty-acyl-phospholipid synthase family protein [Novosphingobium sp.]